MKKIFSIALFAIVSLVNAQNELPKTATDISPLLIGEKIPDVILKSVDNQDVNLSGLLRKKRTVLVFYRGGWCPYCNLHLSALSEAEATLLNLGYQIIAISPDSPTSLKTTQEKDKVNYILLSDSDGKLATMMGIAFQAPENYKSMLAKNSDGINSGFLPVPSVYLVNFDKEIQFEFVTPNYKHRITNDLLIAAAKSLKD